MLPFHIPYATYDKWFDEMENNYDSYMVSLMLVYDEESGLYQAAMPGDKLQLRETK